MRINRNLKVVSPLLAVLLLLGGVMAVSAQGHGNHGGGGGNPNPGHMGGPPASNPGMGRTLSSVTNNGSRPSNRNNNANGSKHSNSLPSDNELNRYRGISRKLGTSPATLNKQYQAALAINPNLKFGQFVAANVVADNLHERYPNVTTAGILAGLSKGRSIGQTLQSLRVDPVTAKDAEKTANRQIKDSRNGD